MTYTPEMTVSVLTAYKEGQTVEAIATTIGRSVRSVIAKLAKEGAYTPKVVNKVARVTKATMISAIAVKFGVTNEDLASLEKADKATLQILSGMR